MILEALVRHYDRLVDQPESGIARYGYSLQQIGFCLLLEEDGSLRAIEPVLDATAGKPRPQKRVVPGQSKPPGAGINPCFLWDNPTYLLGAVPDGRDPEWAEKRFTGFRDRHLALRDTVPMLADDAGFAAVCRFLEHWDPAQLQARADTDPLTRPGFGVFRVKLDRADVHDRPAVRAYWEDQLDAAPAPSPETTDGKGDDDGRGLCLVTGQRRPIARLHEPKIKGVAGGQSSGATLVSFNEKAYESLGHEQGDNAPVGEQIAFKYATALNALLADTQHRLQLGDTTVVFWTEPTPGPAPHGKPSDGPAIDPATEADWLDPADALAEALGVYRDRDADAPPDAPADQHETRSALQSFLTRFAHARSDPAAPRLDDPRAQTPFYVLGLAPNAARISVRFWLQSTVKQLADRLQQHVQDLRIVGVTRYTPTLWQLTQTTARVSSEVKPHVAGEVARAFLTGRPFPELFAQSILTRILAEGSVSPIQAAGLKAHLSRHGNHPMTVFRNTEHPSKAYHCGRLLATLAFAQKEALGNVNAGVIRRNMGSVMSAPGSMLGRLQRAAETGHLPKLDTKLQQFCRDELASINAALGNCLPRILRTQGQSLFALGFYQQQRFLDFINSQVTSKHRHPTHAGIWVQSTLDRDVANALTKFGVVFTYEPSIELGSATKRLPDFVLRGNGGPETDVYIEAAGSAKDVDPQQYRTRHDLKVQGYQEVGITTDGGKRGTLVVLDYMDPKVFFRDTDLLGHPAIRTFIATASGDPTQTATDDHLPEFPNPSEDA